MMEILRMTMHLFWKYNNERHYSINTKRLALRKQLDTYMPDGLLIRHKLSFTNRMLLIGRTQIDEIISPLQTHVNMNVDIDLFICCSHISGQIKRPLTIVFASAIFHQQFTAYIRFHLFIADKQVMKLLGYQNVAYIVPQGSYVGGQRLMKKDLKRGIMFIEQDKCEAAVMSIYVNGAGLNCQIMNSIIFMGPFTFNYQIKQANGNSFQLLLTLKSFCQATLSRHIDRKWAYISFNLYLFIHDVDMHAS